MMEFEADRMTSLVLDDDVIAPERDVVLEERRMRIETDPAAQLPEAMAAALFVHHPYGMPIIGWMHEIERLNREDALAYYRPLLHARQRRSWSSPATSKATKSASSPRRHTARWRAARSAAAHSPHRTGAEYQPNRYDDRSSVTIPSFARYWLAPSYRTAEAGEAEAFDLLA